MPSCRTDLSPRAHDQPLMKQSQDSRTVTFVERANRLCARVTVRRAGRVCVRCVPRSLWPFGLRLCAAPGAAFSGGGTRSVRVGVREQCGGPLRMCA